MRCSHVFKLDFRISIESFPREITDELNCIIDTELLVLSCCTWILESVTDIYSPNVSRNVMNMSFTQSVFQHSSLK